MIDPFAELVQFDEALSDLNQRVRGRMARVVSSNAHMVTVEVPGPGGWDGPLGPYPATVTGLAVRALGVLLPLRGGAALFIAIGGGSVLSGGGAAPMAMRPTGGMDATFPVNAQVSSGSSVPLRVGPGDTHAVMVTVASGTGIHDTGWRQTTDRAWASVMVPGVGWGYLPANRLISA